MISSEDLTDCQRLVNTCRQHKYKNIPARLDKKSGCGGGFASADEQGIYDNCSGDRFKCQSDEIIFYGNLNGKGIQGYAYSVYGTNGIAATITAVCGGGHEPFILVRA